MNSINFASYASPLDAVNGYFGSSEVSLHRSSQIKRKPPPKVTIGYEDLLASTREIAGNLVGGHESLPDILLRSPTPDTHNFWNSLNDSDSHTEKKSSPAIVGRPRAHTVPSRRFTNLVRVPPPVADIGLLASERTPGASRSANLPEQAVHDPDPRADVVSHSADVVVPSPPHVGTRDGAERAARVPAAPSQDLPPRMEKSKSFRLSFMQKRKSSLGGLSVASISAPIIQAPSRKYSVVSMASTSNNNASTISLSVFPKPPEVIPPPVSTLPSLGSFDLPKPEMDSLRSYILHVDPPLQPSNVVDDTVESQQPNNESVSGATGSPAPTAVKGKSPMPRTPLISEHRGPPREPYFDFGEPPDLDEFNETKLPTQQQLEEAAGLSVISESGVRVPFGRLWLDQKTIVCFIRHFWCPLCQDYMFSISRNVSPEVLEGVDIRLVVISNGSYEMIKSYRRIFRTPFALYTDPTHKVYNALGMTLQTMEKGPRGNYVRHGLVGGIGMVVVNAVKVGMPVWKEGGEISQLGGEFILGPGMTCSWVHRMKYTRNHVPILQVIEAAGVDMYTPLHRAMSSTGASFLGMTSVEESKWMERRRKILKKLKTKKMSRRGGTQWIDTASTSTATSSKRSGVESEAAGSLCSWNPSTEQALNIGLMGDEDAIIEEEEEDETEAQIGPDVEENNELAPSEILSDTKSEYSNSFVSQDDSELESSATDVDSTVEGHSAMEVSFDPIAVHFDNKIGANARTFSGRGSVSSLGSGYDMALFAGFGHTVSSPKGITSPSMSESSLGSF